MTKALLFRPVSGFKSILPTRVDLYSQGQPGTAGSPFAEAVHGEEGQGSGQRHPREVAAYFFKVLHKCSIVAAQGPLPDPTALYDHDKSLQPHPGSRLQVTLQRSPPAPPTHLGRSRPRSWAQPSMPLLPANSTPEMLPSLPPQGPHPSLPPKWFCLGTEVGELEGDDRFSMNHTLYFAITAAAR